MVDAILFDLDNTLTDRVASMRAYAHQFASHFDPRLAPIESSALCDTIMRAYGEGYNAQRADDLNRSLPWLDQPSSAEIATHWLDVFPGVTAARADAKSTLRVLRDRGVQMGLVTNGGAEVQRTKIACMKLGGYFGSVIISAEVGVSKPDPAIFRLALAELGVEAVNTIFVGDDPENDVVGAQRVGMRAVWISSSQRWPVDTVPKPPTITELIQVLAHVPAAT